MLSKGFLLALLTSMAVGHPGEEHDYASEIKARDLATHHQARSLSKCFGRRNIQELQERAVKRRVAKAASLRKARGLPDRPYYLNRRDFASFAALNHNQTSGGYTLESNSATVFGSNYSCILVAEVTEGPYYVNGEYIRQDVTEGQEGVAVHLEIQTIDVSTCEPVSGLYYDLWHANSTGVYSGVIANGNGDSSDQSNLNNTALRGLQPVDDDGVVAFDTLFPGHYTGRTNHIHVAAHQGGSVLANNTYGGGTVSHVGQLFFDQNLISDVQTSSPYSTNTQAQTENTEDNIASGEADSNYDPFVEYAYLGDSITDGLLMWISIGVDMTASYSPNAAASLTSAGGVANANSGFGGGSGGGSPPNGTMGSPPGGNSTGGPGGNFTGAPPSGSMSGAPSGSAAPSGSVAPGGSSGSGNAVPSVAPTSISDTVVAGSSSVPSSASPASSSSAATGSSNRNPLSSASSSRAPSSQTVSAPAGASGSQSAPGVSGSHASFPGGSRGPPGQSGRPTGPPPTCREKTVTVTVTQAGIMGGRRV